MKIKCGITGHTGILGRRIIKKLPLYAAEDVKKVNFFRSLLTSLNYLIWGDV